MIVRKRLHLIVIALCLWLPLQAIAGQWLHCAQLESSLVLLDSKTEQTTKPSCHETISLTQHDNNIAAPDQSQTPTDSKNCNHCQFSCSWHAALVLREFTPPDISTSIIYSQFTILSPAQPSLATPQRPPQFCV